MTESMKQLALALRNRLSPTNKYRIDRQATFRSRANILSTTIRLEGVSELVLEEGVRLRKAELFVRGTNNLLVLRKGSAFSGRIELFGNNNVVTIGKETAINGALLVAHNGRKIEIGSGCLFSKGIELRTTDSHKIFDASGRRLNEDADIQVGDHVWLGDGVAVLKGVTIGAGSVVGMRSIVTKSLPPESLAAGVPARVVRSAVSWAE
jgi:acetyltransferase-like isoleucine patch superfamily enzyme